MDPDHASHPARFQRQAEVITLNREISILGSWMAGFGELDGPHRLRKFPQGQDEISKLARFRNPLAHLAVMFRQRARAFVLRGLYKFCAREALWSRKFL